MRWHITVQICVRRNQDIVPNMDIAYNDSVDAYPDTVPYDRRPFVFLAYCNSLMNIAIISYDRILIYRNAIRMPYIQPLADSYTAGDVAMVYKVCQLQHSAADKSAVRAALKYSKPKLICRKESPTISVTSPYFIKTHSLQT